MAESRRRSASPGRGGSRTFRDRDEDDRTARKKTKTSGGFKWKDKGYSKDSAKSGKKDEGFKSKMAREDQQESRTERLDREAREAYEDEQAASRDESTNTKQSVENDDIAAKFGASAAKKFHQQSKEKKSSSSTVATPGDAESKVDKPKKEKPPPPPSNEPMILVTVNDRLGTKAQIPCLASDPVKLFKAMVASRIGRRPHEIMLKRQGERPFKDQLTLEDYGVGNGVQLDLELDTGD